MKMVCTDSNNNTYFKCLNSDVYYSIETALPSHSKFSDICRNDPYFYQTCGAGHKEVLTSNSNLDILCGYYICQDDSGSYTSSYKADYSYSCNKVNNCHNTALDEADCSESDREIMNELTIWTPNSKICDGVCNLHNCEDESFCNGLIYGVKIDGNYTPPFEVKPTFPLYDEDDASCISLRDNTTTHIFNYTRCAPFIYSESAMNEGQWLFRQKNPFCTNFIDQTNCTDKDRVAMTCIVNGFPATISKQILCHGIDDMNICNDGIENVCFKLSASCTVHKHKMCDNTDDCLDRSDEMDLICFHLTNSNCERRLGNKNLPLPLAWLGDNVSDCYDGKDEVEDYWPVCRAGSSYRFVSDNSSCTEYFICFNGNLINLEELCDRIETCGNENEICKVSRRRLDLWTSQPTDLGGTKHLFHCLKGLATLKHHTAECKNVNFSFNRENVFGLSKSTKLNLPLKTYDCKNTYGELYVYTACMENCDSNVDCPLSAKVSHDSCSGQYSDRVYTIQNSQDLTFLLRSKGSYHSNIFVCKNNKCIDYNQVCDLVNDCGDNSDEDMCINHFECTESKEYIYTTQVCNGVIDCKDLSDECNGRCGKQIIGTLSLKVFAWGIGIMAVIFNIIVIIENLQSLRRSKKILVLLNKILILLISLGDLLVGEYLILISYMDLIHNTYHCVAQQEWITSKWCFSLGLISTIGSQISLLSMTALSCARFSGIRNSMRIGGGIDKKSITLITMIVVLIISSSCFIAAVPLFNALEDFFVNGVYYDDTFPLFIGLTDKKTNIKILEAYYGSIRQETISWKIINKLVGNMFTTNYDGITYKKVEFYGNDPVCLFKYFVLQDDPQKPFVWIILLLDFTCFLIISISYIAIAVISIGSSKELAWSGSTLIQQNRNKKMQRKISLIIFTDFCCWLPFIIVCGLHTLDVVDASSWYSLFSIIALPINSVINPLLYDNSIYNCFQKAKHTATSLLLEFTNLAYSIKQEKSNEITTAQKTTRL